MTSKVSSSLNYRNLVRPKTVDSEGEDIAPVEQEENEEGGRQEDSERVWQDGDPGVVPGVDERSAAQERAAARKKARISAGKAAKDVMEDPGAQEQEETQAPTPQPPAAPVMANAAEDGDIRREQGEATGPRRVLRKPEEPTKAEREAHDVSHVPFRSWCADCVSGRGVETPHSATTNVEEDAAPLISGDYGFVNDERQQGGGASSSSSGSNNRVLLGLHDSRTGSVKSMIVPHKGAAYPWIAKKVAAWINSLGYNKVRFRADKENAIMALAREIKIQRGADVETVIEPARQGDKRSNGAAERAVRTSKDMLRTLKMALERRIGVTIPPEADVLTWMAEHGSYLHNRFQVGANGRTPDEQVRGRRSQLPLCCFGERVLYMPLAAGRGGDLQSRFLSGVMMGVQGAEYLVMTGDGAVRAHSLRRVPMESRWDKEIILQMKGTPWAPRGGGVEEPIPATRPGSQQVEEPVAGGNQEVPERRRMRMEKEDFIEHQYTPGCRGCTNLQAGRPAQGHSEKCRKRMEEELKKTAGGAARVARAYDKIDEAAAARAEQQIGGDVGNATGRTSAEEDEAVAADQMHDGEARGSSSAEAAESASRAAAPEEKEELIEGEAEAKRRRILMLEDSQSLLAAEECPDGRNMP